MGKSKLLVLTSTFPRWENDTVPPFVLELSKRLSGSFDVKVLAPHSPGARRREILCGLDVFRFPYWPGRKDHLTGAAIGPALKRNKLLWALVPVFLISELFSIVRLLRTERPDLIHAHWILPQGLLAVIGKMLAKSGAPLVITAHGADVLSLRALDPVKKWTINCCSALTVVSNALRAEVQKMGVDREIPVEVIPMGVDLSAFCPEKRDESLRRAYTQGSPVLLFVGRLSEKKGVEYLIRALPEVIRTYPEAKLLILGDGEQRKSLENTTSMLGLGENNIAFAGGVENSKLPSYYASADIFIGPSIVTREGDSEGFGLIFVEAMGSGCPVIASDLPAIRDIVEDGRTGLLVKPGNVQGLSEAIIRLLGYPALAASLKVAGREYVLGRFDWRRIAEKYRELFTKYL